jgi:hypothetical protein
MKRFSIPPAVRWMLAVVVLAGCTSKPERPQTYPITGTVIWKGQPVEAARVVFVPTAPGVEAAAGITDAQGKYKATTYGGGDGAQAGEYRVKVSKYDNQPPTAEEQQPELPYEEEVKIYAEDERRFPPAKNLLPTKYEDEATSGLVHTVTNSPTTLDITIE